MRVTIDIDDDVLDAVKAIAKNRRITAGRVLSDLVRSELPSPRRSFRERNGVPLLPKRKGARSVTGEMAKRLLDDDIAFALKPGSRKGRR
jgi:hypothetical protein